MQYSNLGLIDDLYSCNINSLLLHRKVRLIIPLVGCVAQLVERRSLTGELSLSYARPAADG